MVIFPIVLRTETETLEFMLELGRLLSSKLELDDLLKTVLELSARVVNAETASLLMLDPKTQELYFDVALGLGPEASQMRLPLGKGIAGCVALNMKPEIINNARTDPRWSDAMDEKSGFTTRSILAVPMVLKGQLIGVVEAINKKSGNFIAEDLRTLEAFASQAAVAIDNARLFASLREESHKLNSIVTQMSDAAVLTNDQSRILMANPAAHKILAVGTDIFCFRTALSNMKVTPTLDEIMSGKEPSLSFCAVREKPTQLVLSGQATRISPSQNHSRETPGWLYVFRDITEEALKLKLKRTFLSLISHKLRTPLAAVTGFAEILQSELRQQPKNSIIHKAAQTISSQSRKLTMLVDKLLRYITLEGPDTTVALAPCPLDAVISEAIKSMTDWLEENNASILFEPAGIEALGDQDFLKDVVKNLIENAVKFNDKPSKKVAIWVETQGPWALLNIKDQGPGIPPEEQDRIFSQFHQVEASFTGQVEGWGLGLAFVKKVVELHKGEVRLVSKLGEGTTLIISLPRSSR